MTTFTGRFTVGSNLTLTSPVDLGTAKYSVNMDTVHSFTDGEGLNQAEQVYTKTRTLAASANEELDLSGSLSGHFGTTLTFTSIKVMIITCAVANTNDLLVGGAAVNAWSTWASDDTDEVIVVPGGTLALFAPDAGGYTVTAGTGDLLRIENSSGGTSVTYDIILVGTV